MVVQLTHTTYMQAKLKGTQISHHHFWHEFRFTQIEVKPEAVFCSSLALQIIHPNLVVETRDQNVPNSIKLSGLALDLHQCKSINQITCFKL